MRYRVIPALKTLIPLFVEKPSHPVVPLGHRTAGARSECQGRPLAGARALPVASTLVGWRSKGGREIARYAGLLLAGVLADAACPVAVSAQATPVARANPADPYAGFITEAAQRFAIPEHWIRAVLRAESAGDVRAISSAGAMGLMQVMPDTWAGLRVRHGLGRDPYDARDNIMAGAAYLREMWDRYGNVAAMLAAYNASPGRYDEHRTTGRASTATAARLARGSAVRHTLDRHANCRPAVIRSAIRRHPRDRSGARCRQYGAADRQHFRGSRRRRECAMRTAFPRSARSVPVFSQAGFFLSGISAGRAKERAR